jgi:hypothetical protein
VELFQGNLPVIQPADWAHYVDAVVKLHGSVEVAARNLSQQIAAKWNLTSDEIQNVLGNHIQTDFVRVELEHRTGSCRIAQKLVLLTVRDELIPLPGIVSKDDQLNLALIANDAIGRPAAGFERALRETLMNAGFPLAIVPALLSGQSIRGIARSSNVDRTRIARAIACLPNALIRELNETQTWKIRSWVTLEIRKRYKKER